MSLDFLICARFPRARPQLIFASKNGFSARAVPAGEMHAFRAHMLTFRYKSEYAQTKVKSMFQLTNSFFIYKKTLNPKRTKGCIRGATFFIA
ncbi:MAG: hypothetical protein K0S51_207 [Bacillales bacterium]|jgi:hypothetical protein|nr:hypothetical protein [Bacillales bacterium]